MKIFTDNHFYEWINSDICSITCCQEGRYISLSNMDIFQLFFNYLEERPCKNIQQNVKQDGDYPEATMKENELNEQYKKLDLSDEQRKIITKWIDALQAQESAYASVVFRMGMQFCFSLLIQLADL